MKTKTINLLLIFTLLAFSYTSQAANIKCFENENDKFAVNLFLSFADNSQTAIAFEEFYTTPHPQKNWGFIFGSIQQSQSNRYLFPKGVYTGVATTTKQNEVTTSYGILTIEEEGEWAFSHFNYQLKGTYLFIDSHSTQMVPVYCRFTEE